MKNSIILGIHILGKKTKMIRKTQKSNKLFFLNYFMKLLTILSVAILLVSRVNNFLFLIFFSHYHIINSKAELHW